MKEFFKKIEEHCKKLESNNEGVLLSIEIEEEVMDDVEKLARVYEVSTETIIVGALQKVIDNYLGPDR